MTSLGALLRLKTRRLELKPLRRADAAALRAITDMPAIAGAIEFLPSPFTLAAARALIARNEDERECFVGVRRRGRLAGVVGAHRQNEERIEIGYWVGPAYQGQGIATEAAGAVVAALGENFSVRIVAECRPENRASWRVLEKLGFRATGEEGARPGRKLLALP